MPRIYLERRDMTDDLRQLFDLLDDQARASAPPGECNPPADVLETPGAIEIIMDLPGVTADRLTIAFSRGTLIVSGVKKPEACHHHDAAFHLAERAFGRFTRAFRIAGAVDAGSARATLSSGELRIVVPRIADRRGREIRIAVESV
jgi:HSP20 family protein